MNDSARPSAAKAHIRLERAIARHVALMSAQPFFALPWRRAVRELDAAHYELCTAIGVWAAAVMWEKQTRSYELPGLKTAPPD